ncbi:OOP family OmpA-OmpF porin [Rubricella aquisinus]|uniref:OOP family OmpA-OmpF porin n=1 Tax=Rubricella aquisinus TaxID=2028108 RepID=A0A840WLU6_9RHOB|nr:OmpA family protein [Rubricella aquisinus]MBB5514622.1 OOP family OmpA-OmpF porin [Rubricella aquisinus]
MRAIAILFVLSCWIGAAFGAAHLARVVVAAVEQGSVERVSLALDAAGHDWAVVSADGLVVTLAGEAPDDPARRRALDVAVRSFAGEEVRDEVTVLSPDSLRDVPLNVTILRSPELITLVGSGVRLTDDAFAGDPLSLLTALRQYAPDVRIVSLMSGMPATAPDEWDILARSAARIAGQLATGEIRIHEDGLAVTTVSEGQEAAEALRALLTDAAGLPAPLSLSLDIMAPAQPILTYRLVVEKRPGTYRITDCTMPDAESVARLMRLMTSLEMAEDEMPCQIGSGAPDDWIVAAEAVLAALNTISAGDAAVVAQNVTFRADSTVTERRRDAAREALVTALPAGYTLAPLEMLPDAAPDATAPPLRVVLNEVDGVTIDGRLPTPGSDAAMLAYAQAAFGSDRVTVMGEAASSARLADTLSVIEALGQLTEGEASIGAGSVRLTGVGGQPDIADRLEATLSKTLDPSLDVTLAVSYRPDATPAARSELTARICEQRVNEVLQEGQIAFAPSSAVIDEESGRRLDRIAEILLECRSKQIKISGYTDNRGGEEVNLAISTARAESVLDALLRRGIFLDRMVARGYGEADPIADNDTEEGRAANRRIEIRLIGPDE